MARWHYCNVIRHGKESRDLWQFLAANRKFIQQKHETKLASESLSQRLFAKDWEHLVQPRLNVAWLPPSQVFLRVVHLPKAEPEETRSMLDLQMEKLSPIPIGQAVWGYEVFDQPGRDMQTALVIIVSRHVVESYLGELESLGFLADRLEVPFVDQLRSQDVQQDGIWVFAGWGSDAQSAVMAWRVHGILQHLTLVHLPQEGNPREVFLKQIKQMTWTAELEGWLETEPRFYLVGTPEITQLWQGYFELDESVSVELAMSASDLALLTAKRVASNGTSTNLLPADFQSRYKQLFVDRLWMRGLGAAIALYMIGVAVYFGWVEISKWKLDNVTSQVAALSLSYTNALRLKEQVQVMNNQMALQFAALDCWKIAADNLPTELTLDQFNFDHGQRVTYFGRVAMEDVQRVNDFYDAVRIAKIAERRLFKTVDPPKINPRPPREMAWSFVCELERAESE